MPANVNSSEHLNLLLSEAMDRIKLNGPGMQKEKAPGYHVGHISVFYQDRVILLSGHKGYKNNNAETYYRPCNEIWMYNQTVENWTKKICTGETSDEDIPRERSGATGTIVDDCLYMFGGFSEKGNLNTLNRLNLQTLQWRLLEPSGTPPVPCDKTVSWQHDGKVYFFGGYGHLPVSLFNLPSHEYMLGFQFSMDVISPWHYRRGWNNQLVCYDPTSNSWQWPKTWGDIPVPRAAHCAAKIGNMVYIFGGRHCQTRMNDLHMLNMETLEWTTLIPADSNSPVIGRSWSSLTPISDHQLILYGGFSHDDRALGDCWLFDTLTCRWQQVMVPFNEPRLWHAAVLSNFDELLICGGAIDNINHSIEIDEKTFAKEMLMIQFKPKSLLRQCLSAVASTPLRPQWQQLPQSLRCILIQRCMAKSKPLPDTESPNRDG